MFKKHIYTFLVFVLLFSISTNAQMISGKIVSQSDGTIIPYAHIIIDESHTGTISNAEGKFELNLDKQANQLKLTISSIGFKTTSIVINKNELKSRYNILLEQAKFELDEFKVVYESPETILKKFQKNYSTNYNSNSFLLKGFYRTTFSENGIYVNLLEASVNVREFPKGNKRLFETAITQQRKSNDYRTEKWSESGNYLYQTVAENPVVKQTEFLNLKHLKYYNLKRLDNTSIGEDLVYVISFTAKPEAKHPLPNATVYIQANNYALIKANYTFQNDELKIKNLHYNNKTIHTSSSDGSIEYQKVGDWYYPKYVSGNTSFEIISKETGDTLVKDILMNEILFTSFEDNYNTPLENTTKKWGDVYKKPFDYNPKYWKNEVKLPPTKLHQDAITDLANFQSLEVQYFNNSAKNKLTQSFENTTKGKIDSLLSIYHLTNLFNGVALVTNNDKILIHKAYGYADFESKIKLTPSTIFDIGSITKQYTAAIILKLMQNGQLKLEDNIGQYLPNYKHPKITIHQLLSHTSGIPTFDYEENEYNPEWFKNSLETNDFITKFCSNDLDFKPGAKMDYSNSNYLILTAIIEKITSKNYYEVFKDETLIPLELNATYPPISLPKTNLAKGYVMDNTLINEPVWEKSNMKGAGCIHSNATDLLTWINAQTKNNVLTLENYNLMKSEQTYYEFYDADFGYSWAKNKTTLKSNDQIYFYGGTSLGFYSMIVSVPSKGINIILLNNTGDFPRIELCNEILKQID